MGEFSLTMSTSDDFISVATKEINEEIVGMETILMALENNDDVLSNAEKLQRHTHKIKGLAPMMGKITLGEIASQLDDILKKIMDGKKPELFGILNIAIGEMKHAMNSSYDFNDLQKSLSDISSSMN